MPKGYWIVRVDRQIDGSHSPDEDLEIASIERATIRAAILIYRLTR
jgi:hypothetical protein